MKRIVSEELVSKSVLEASSTDPQDHCFGNNCGISNIKQTAPNDETNHPTNWQSAADPNCAPIWVTADWSAKGPYTVSSLSVLYTQNNGGAKTNNIQLKKSDGSYIDISKYLLCVATTVYDDDTPVKWDICALDYSAPPGTFTNIIGAKWNFQPVRGLAAPQLPQTIVPSPQISSAAPSASLSVSSTQEGFSVIPSSSQAATGTTTTLIQTSSLAVPIASSLSQGNSSLPTANGTLALRDDGAPIPRCQMGLYELQMHGIAMPRTGLPISAVFGIVLGLALVTALGVVCCCLRKSSTRKNIANWLMQPSGGWQRLELWKDGDDA
ncbi:hypothetical protein BC830DRAFT_1118249 [Chytriomyces sp. MP71]|nr:hypothetical protein BC830DRAFT_1118249 [Chytriomyces sp. MP71]